MVEIFRSPGNEIFQIDGRNISFPGERNFPIGRSGNFVPRGTKFFRLMVEIFRSPGNEISLLDGREISFPGERNFSD